MLRGVGRGTTDGDIREAVFEHRVRFVHVATVDDDGELQGLIQLDQVELAELFPVCEDEQGVCALGCIVGAAGVGEVLGGREDALGVLDGGWVIGDDAGAGFEELADDLDGG